MLNQNDRLNNAQYASLLSLYNQYKDAFNYLPDYIKQAFYARLYAK